MYIGKLLGRIGSWEILGVVYNEIDINVILYLYVMCERLVLK